MSAPDSLYEWSLASGEIPKELRFEGKEVSIRRLGDGVLLVPLKASSWPAGFFESVRIDDANFTRPEQGELPPVADFTE